MGEAAPAAAETGRGSGRQERGQGPPLPIEPIRACPRCGLAAWLGPLDGVLVAGTVHYVCHSCPCWFWVVW
jgi:hypothetical protein